MPLSEEELRLLEQMERALVAEDPKLASAMRGPRVHRHARRRMIAGGLGFVAGIGLLMTGVVIREGPGNIIVGPAGFVVMLVSAYLALSAWRGQAAAAAEAESEPPAEGGESGLRMIAGGKRSRRPASRSQGSMMERFEERWRRRREQGFGRDDY